MYPGFAWLIGRCLWIAHRDRGSRGSVVWPTWVLVAATLCLAGYRIDLNINHSNVIDVGLSGVIGADRIARFQDPYGNFPVEDGRPHCGPADASGEVRDHIQTNGRCEAADPQGTHMALWPTSPTCRATLPRLERPLGFVTDGPLHHDSLGSAGDHRAVVRRGTVRRPATRRRVLVRLGGLALHAVLVELQHKRPDRAGLAVWGFYFLTSPVKRGLFAAFSAWTKFASLVVVPLWSAYPTAGVAAAIALRLGLPRRHRAVVRDPALRPISAARRPRLLRRHLLLPVRARFAVLALGLAPYHAKGLPNLRWVQRVLFGTLVAGSIALAWWPRRRSPLRMAAYTGALLIGFELVLTHWSWLYLPWFFPFVAIALLTPRLVGPVRIAAHPVAEQERIVQQTWSERQRLVAKFAAASAVFLCCWGLIGHGFYSKPSIVDVGLYQIYGSDIQDGDVPYRDFSLEYPPGALPVFVAPTVSQRHYRRDFSWLMAASGVLCIAFLTLARAPRYALLFVAVSPLLLGSLVTTHFDFWPTAFVVGALAAFVRAPTPSRLGCPCRCDHDQGVRGRPRAARGRLDAPSPRSRRADARSRDRSGGRRRGRVAVPGVSPGGLSSSLWRQLTRPSRSRRCPVR